MRFLHMVVQNAEISHQLAEIRTLELASFRLNDNQSVQFAVEKEQVGEKLHAINFQMILVPNKGEIFPKSEDKFLDVLHNLLFHNPFVHIFLVALANLFHIDEIQKIGIFEHHHGFAGERGIGQSRIKVVGKRLLVFMRFLFDKSFE